ncbi:L-threonylcarbamoyladenylate synthase [Rhizobium alvei]|uniref:Threonylcarbamoyl-AMP synthase n=1 Tax=Rhizobium alvei TaxID=1132659 RepID=A0ABT8YG74_9HYPH|nr:L-threonylcarbamoyladenylate synthase [Rhizobium alvei]MDO6962671.1 L-threonylcarbamoyladenylate synthase [Rhizobium alvei]
MADIITIADEPERALDRACQVLAEAEPVAMPTETVYGLAADATNPDAIARIYEIKGRPRFNPLIAHVSNLEMAEAHATFDPLSLKLAKAFWPGPLTLVLPLKPESAIHPLCTAGLSTVGLRWPRGFAGDLIARYGKPLAAPSANTSGRISPTSAEHVAADLGEKLQLILDGGAAGVGVESTIIKVDAQGVHLLRPGGLSVAAIEAEIGQPVLRSEHAAGEAIEAPGMLASHYAPTASVRLNAGTVSRDEVLINFGDQPIAGRDEARAIFELSKTGNLREAAANLFSTMIKADAVGAGRIAFAPVPDQDLGEAINDRIRRAAAPRGEEDSQHG